MSRMAAHGRYYPTTGPSGRYSFISLVTGVLSKSLSSLAVSSSATTLTWSSTVPNVPFTQGIAEPYSLVQHTSGFNPSLHQFSQLTGTQPPGVTLLPTFGLSYDGVGPVASATNLSYRIVDNAAADWNARSTAAGVTYKQGFGNAAAVTPYFFDNGGGEVAAGYISIDTSEGSADGLAALKITTPRSSVFGGRNGATFRHSLNSAWTSNSDVFALGTDIYICWRIKGDAGRLIPNNSDGWKFLIAAQFSHQDGGVTGASNSGLSFVGQDQVHRGFPQAYHYTPVQENFEENRGGVGILLQNAVDNGGTPNSSRYCLYPGPYAGCWKWVADEWATLQIRIRIGQYGGASANNQFEMWAAHQDAVTWTKTHSFSGFTVGTPQSGYAGLNGLHWLIYETNRELYTVTSDATVKYRQILVGTQMHALPAVGA